MEGTFFALRSAAENCNITLTIDNYSGLRPVDEVLPGSNQLPRYGFGFVAELAELARHRNHEALWVPGHGERQPIYTVASTGGANSATKPTNALATPSPPQSSTQPTNNTATPRSQRGRQQPNY